ncbi:MAG TPA: DUF1326 domain-containing protein [Phycisphaerae bacterium]|nr:DUF1326 domain-containing protein [Phycisphaerae bacterium]
MKRVAALLTIALLTLAPFAAFATPDTSHDPALSLPDASIPLNNVSSLETREFHFRNARLPGLYSEHQDVTAWQVTQGSWNGQSLDGLCLVLVHTASDDGHSSNHTNCYVSEFATSAQRQALLTAFLASNPSAIPASDASSLRLEPAVITFQLDGQTLTLHLGLVA